MKEMDYVIMINDYSETFNNFLFIVIHNSFQLGYVTATRLAHFQK